MTVDQHDACATRPDDGRTDASAQAAQPAAAEGLVSFPCDASGVERLIPHRAPFLWVSRVIECVPGESIVAELDVDPALPLFKGHFPDYPVLPGVILMEALAQTACCCMMAQPGMAGQIGFFAGIDKAKFREQVRPGDTVRLEATIVRNSKRLCVAETAAYKDGVLCAQAVQKYVMAKKEGLQ